MPLSTVTISVGARVRRQRDDLRRQAVAELEAIRHQKIHRGEAPGAQRAHHQRGAGRAVGIEVADHQHPAARAMREQQLDGACGTPASVPTGNSAASEMSSSVVERTPRAA